MMGEKLKDLGYESGLWTLQRASEPGGGEAACLLPEVAAEFGLDDGREHSALSAKRSKPHHPGRIIPEGAFKDGTAIIPEPILYAIKAPVFSFQKLSKVEPSLGPEMKSTGEILGIDNTFDGALYKAMVGSGIHFKGDGLVLLTVKDEDKAQAVKIAKGLHKAKRKIAATPGTADVLDKAGVPCERINKIQQGSPNILDLVMDGKVSLMINTPSLTETSESEAARIRRACIETGVPCMTTIDTAEALIHALDVFADPTKAQCLRLEEYFAAKA
jgi:carbamoyl-phosphate synthase large subunit